VDVIGGQLKIYGRRIAVFLSQIMQQIILPIVLLIGVGVILQRTFQFEMKVFSKLILYLYLPAVTFVKIYEAKADPWLLLSVFGILIIHFSVLCLLGRIVSRFRRHSKKMVASFSNSIVLTNNGNVGIPVNDLAFQHNPLAMSIQLIIVLFELFATFTYGLMNASAASGGLKNTVLQFVKLPIFYMFILGLTLNTFQMKISDFIWIPVNTLSNGMLSIALVSIGAQVANVRFYQNTINVILSCFIRLIISPTLAFLLITILDFHGTVAQTIWIASAMPSSRNSAALALEYDNEPEFAAQTVLLSTLCSSITLTGVIYLSMSFFQ
jgi:predicted permease